ncbi:restriction endonuclease subunit S [Bordetella genomosp. 13]|nr:restriction endonuclease subunit S [Bordetella genomosp. 13]
MLQTEKREPDDLFCAYMRAANIQSGWIDAADVKKMWFSAREREALSLKGGDLLVSEGGDVGRAAIWRHDVPECYFQNSVNRVRSLGLHQTGFLFYWLLALKMRGYVDVVCNKSTIAHFTAEKVEAVPTPFPCPREQHHIAAFLDRETAKIDDLIAEQKKLIALLAEKRQATISHAVTRGLNPDTPIKDSEVAWLGEVPAHWQVDRLANIFQEVVEAGRDELPILSVSIHNGVSDRELREDEMERNVARSEDRSKYKSVLPDDLVYNMMRAWQGAFGTVTVPGMVSPAYVVARPLRRLLTEFIELLLRTPAAITEMKRHSRGITDFRLRLYWEDFRNVQVALPQLEEQQSIVDYIRAESARLDELRKRAEQAIALLKERRAALIAAAVTGQIDVRGVTALTDHNPDASPV